VHRMTECKRVCVFFFFETMVTVRSTINPLWFDREKHPEKHELFENMLQEEMETIRAGEKTFDQILFLRT
jgi:hypothetical protein